jgi:hypothetical protein
VNDCFLQAVDAFDGWRELKRPRLVAQQTRGRPCLSLVCVTVVFVASCVGGRIGPFADSVNGTLSGFAEFF